MTAPFALVDVGDLMPLRVRDWRTAKAVAATFVPPTGDVEREEPAHDFATPGGRDSARSHPIHAIGAGNAVAGMPTEDPPGGQASGPSVFVSPKATDGPDAPELNVLPEGHTRDDFDFAYKGGGRGPIRLSGWEVSGHVEPPRVWCIRHGWEIEVLG